MGRVDLFAHLLVRSSPPDETSLDQLRVDLLARLGRKDEQKRGFLGLLSRAFRGLSAALGSLARILGLAPMPGLPPRRDAGDDAAFLAGRVAAYGTAFKAVIEEDDAVAAVPSLARRRGARPPTVWADLAPGTIVATHFEVERTLGRGPTGSVYAARHAVTGEQFALKVLHGVPGVDVNVVEHLRRELLPRLQRSAATDHVAHVSALGVSAELGGVPFIATELLQGNDLEAELERRGPLPAAEVVRLLQDVARALDAACHVRATHGNLKPENLFLTAREDGIPLVKILDFGTAALTAEGSVIGARSYLAPEQLRWGNSLGRLFASDIWALGLIAFRLPHRAELLDRRGRRPRPPDPLRPDAPAQRGRAAPRRRLRCLVRPRVPPPGDPALPHRRCAGQGPRARPGCLRP